MRRVRAVTFDFWNTLVDGTITPERTARRLALLHQRIVGAGHACSPAALEAAFHRVGERLLTRTRESYEDVGPPGRWALLADEIGIPEGLIPYAVVEQAYEDITLEPAPALLPGIVDAVRELKGDGYRLGVVCNTGMAGGRVLRQVLARHGLLELFDHTTWSNEFGWSKPDPRIFSYTLERLGDVAAADALHVGDMEDLDVAGARNAGMRSALYAPGADADPATDADLIVRDWRSFRDAVTAFNAAHSVRDHNARRPPRAAAHHGSSLD